MHPMPETRNRRFLAIVLLLIVASLVYLVFFHWWFVSPQLDIAAQMADLRERQASFAQTSPPTSLPSRSSSTSGVPPTTAEASAPILIAAGRGLAWRPQCRGERPSERRRRPTIEA